MNSERVKSCKLKEAPKAPCLPCSMAARPPHSAFIFPLRNERQAAPSCPSTVSIPFAFYPSLSQSHCESLPLQSLRHSLTFLRQLSPSCVLIQIFEPSQPCNTAVQPSLSLVLSTGCQPDNLPPCTFMYCADNLGSAVINPAKLTLALDIAGREYPNSYQQNPNIRIPKVSNCMTLRYIYFTNHAFFFES